MGGLPHNNFGLICDKVPHLRIHENHIKAGIMRKFALPQNKIEFDNLICRR